MMPASPPYDPVYDAIIDYLGDGSVDHPGNWDFTLAPLVYENTTDGPPDGDVVPWVLVMLESQLYAQESIGGGQGAGDNRWDETGKLWFFVMTPKGTGSRDARRIAKALANMFRGTTILNGKLYFENADMSAGDPGAEFGNYYQLAVGLDWYLEEAQ